MSTRKNVHIVIPAKDEATRIGSVLQSLSTLELSNVIVVDDGSKDDTSKVSKEHGATVIRHRINLGAGAATQTGIHWALRHGAEIIVTMDGDAQHHPSFVPQLVKELTSRNLDLVIGSRFMDESGKIPWSRLLYNRIANIVSWVLTGMWVSDSQSGMRAMSAEFARKSELHWSGFEFCIEQLRYAHVHDAAIGEVPITAYYSKETIRKGQNLWTGIRMLGTIIRRFTHIS